jgi:hypothetical protein
VPTAYGTFVVVNRTRYRTDDLLDLMARIEVAIPAESCRRGVPRPCPLVEAMRFRGPPQVVFTGRRASGGTAGTGTAVPWLGRFAWHRPTYVRLAHPDDVWESPMEHLAAMLEPECKVPQRHVRALVERLTFLYAWDLDHGRMRPLLERVPLDGAILRVRASR